MIVVDTTRQASTSGYLGATRRGLRRAVGSLPESTWVALIGVDANRISVCDLSCGGATHILRTPVVYVTADRNGTRRRCRKALVPVADLLQTRQLAARLGDHREAVLEAIDALVARSGRDGPQRDAAHDLVGEPSAAIDVALTALLEYFARDAVDPVETRLGDPSLHQTIVAARVSVVCLSGGGEAATLPEDLVRFATVSGVCVDVYAPEAMLLRSRASTMLGPIVCKSGGRFRPCASPLCLEDNVARHVGSAYAAAGTLSVRTSCGFCAAIEESGADGLEIGASFRSDGGAWSSLHGEGEEGVQFCGLHLAGCDASMSVVLPFRMDDSVSSGQAFSS